MSALPRATNDRYLPLYHNRSRYLALMGGAGSGKSVFAAQKLIYRILTEGGHRILVIRKVAATLRHSVYALLRETVGNFGATELCTPQASTLSLDFPAFGSSILCMGIDDPEKLKSIQGITSVWIEEATELEQHDLTQIDLRLRGITRQYKQIMLTYNPISSTHWLKTRFHDQQDADASVLVTTYKDNRFLDAEYGARLEKLAGIDEQYHRVYALGEWGTLAGQVFSNWTVADPPFTIPQIEPHVYYGADFGFNDPTVVLTVGIHDGLVYVLDELYVREATNADLIGALRGRIPGGRIITCDCAEPARIAEISRSGWNAVPATKGQGSVLAGIDWLRTRRIVVAPHCVNTIRELGGYRYQTKKTGELLDLPLGIDDHCIDALRYAVEPYRLASGVSIITPDMIGRRRRVEG